MYRNNFCSYAIKRVLIAVVTFFIISILVTFLIWWFTIPEPEFLIIDESKLSQDQIEFIEAFTHHPSYLEYYTRSISGFFTGDWGESLFNN